MTTEADRISQAGIDVVPSIITTTLSERGPILPIGLQGGQALAVRPWTMVEEKAIGRRLDEAKEHGANMAGYVSIVLSMMCTELGANKWGGDIPEGGSPERELAISQMWMPDVFYAWCWLRLRSLGRKFNMKLKSPHSNGHEFDFTADIRTIEVKVPKTLEDTLWTYQLEHPFMVRGKELKTLVLGPQRWAAVEQMEDGTDGVAKEAIIMASIHRAPGVVQIDGQDIEASFTSGELDGMAKLDIEQLADEINDRGVGPQMTVSATCPKTRKPFEAPIKWGYHDFFGTGSR